jgi:integrase
LSHHLEVASSDFVSAVSATTANGSHVVFALWFADDDAEVIAALGTGSGEVYSHIFTLLSELGHTTKLKPIPSQALLDESDNVRQGFVNPAEFVKLHYNLPAYLKPIIEFLCLTGMRSGAAKKLEHKHVDLEAQVIRLPIELSKNKKGLTIPLSGRLLVLVESAWNNRSLECPYLFHHKVEPIGDFRKAFDAACAACGLQGIVPHDLRRSAVRNFIRAGVKETVAMRLSGHRTRSVFDRYNIVSEDDLVEANEKVLAFLCEAIKESKVEKLKE